MLIKPLSFCTGTDFSNVSFIVEIPAGSTSIHITNITVFDDNINEREENFILVAKILGPAADMACFKFNVNSPCKSNRHIGGIRLRIRDDDSECLHAYITSYVWHTF